VATQFVIISVISACAVVFFILVNGLLTKRGFRILLKRPNDPQIELIAPPKILTPGEFLPGTPLSNRYTISRGLVAVIQLIFVNYGDKQGFVRVSEVNLQETQADFSPEHENILVPNQGLGVYELLLKNLPRFEEMEEVLILVTFEWGGVKVRHRRQDNQPEIGQKKFSALIRY
jgi:hypothetical protein